MEHDRVDNSQEACVPEVQGDRKAYKNPTMAVVGTVSELTGGPVTTNAEANGFYN